jgi:hypothetical protein
MDSHVKVLGWLYIIMGVVGLVIGACVGTLIVGGGLISGDRDAIAVTTIVSLFVGGFLLVTSLPGILAGWGLLAHKSWARILAIILGILNLPGFPVGTALGVYTLYVLLDDETSRLFSA